MYLISSEVYENAGVRFLRVKKHGKIGASMKNVHNGLDVRNTPDLISKEIYSKYQTKNLTNEQIKKYKMT